MAEALNRQLIGKQRGKQRGDGFESRLISIKKEKKEKSAAWIWEGLGRGEGSNVARLQHDTSTTLFRMLNFIQSNRAAVAENKTQ